MDKRDFFDMIKMSCKNELEYALELLRIRGFLIEEEEGLYYFSDNSDNDDPIFAKELLHKHSLGDTEEREGKSWLIISNPENASNLEKEFAKGIQIPKEEISRKKT